jgi:hypothetical protein
MSQADQDGEQIREKRRRWQGASLAVNEPEAMVPAGSRMILCV